MYCLLGETLFNESLGERERGYPVLLVVSVETFTQSHMHMDICAGKKDSLE
jgi:hypothetical protein